MPNVSKSQKESLMELTSPEVANRFAKSKVHRGWAREPRERGGDGSKAEAGVPSSGQPFLHSLLLPGPRASLSRSLDFEEKQDIWMFI